MKRNRAMNEHERTCPDCQRVIAETNAVSRLSHDRGADAWYQQAKRGTEQWVELFEAHNRGDDLGPIFERHVSEASDAIATTLSVPAPTEPEHEPWCYRRHTGDCVDGPSPQSRSVPAPTLPALDAHHPDCIEMSRATKWWGDRYAATGDDFYRATGRELVMDAEMFHQTHCAEALRDAV